MLGVECKIEKGPTLKGLSLSRNNSNRLEHESEPGSFLGNCG